MKIRIIDFGYDKLPFRAHENDAGADVFVPNKCGTNIGIWPHETIKIPLGFGLCVPDGYAAGKTAVNKQLFVLIAVNLKCYG